MKAGWEVNPLLDVCSKITQGPNPKYDGVEDNGFRVLKTKHLYDVGIKYDEADRISGRLFEEHLKAELKDGDILLAIVGQGSINKCNVFEQLDEARYIFTRALGLIRPLPNRVNPFYVKYFLQSDVGKRMVDSGIGGSSGQQVVTTTHLKKMRIPIPPLEEQKRIVAVLDAAFEGLTRAKENAEANLQNARELFEGYLNTTLDLAVDEFGTLEVSKLMDSIVDCVNRTAPKSETETPFKMVRTSNVRNGKLDLRSVNFVTESTYETWTRRQVPQRNDVLLTREAPMGETALVDTDDQIFLGQRIVSYRVNAERMLPEFLLFSFLSKHSQDQFIELGSGSTVQHIRVPHTKTLKVPNVPIADQEQLVEMLSSLRSKSEEMTDTYTTKLQNIAELRQSLLQKAFSGELT